MAPITTAVLSAKPERGDQTGPQREHQERFVEFRVPVVAAVQLLEAIRSSNRCC